MRKRIRYLTKTYPIRTRILFGTFITGIVLICLELILVTFAFPQTKIGALSVSGKTRKQTEKILQSVMEQPITIIIGERSYEFRYEDMGLNTDTKDLVWRTYLPNIQYFPKNALLFLQSLIQGRSIDNPLTDSTDFERFVSTLVFEKINGGDEILFDPETKEIQYIERDIKKQVDRTKFFSLLNKTFGGTKTLVPSLIPVVNPKKLTIDTINSQIQRIYETPLQIRITSPTGETNRQLSISELKEIVTFSLLPDSNEPLFNCSIDTLMKYLPPPNKAVLSPNTVKSTILDAMIARFHGATVNDITIASGEGPNTSGEIAPKYAEIDISNQRLYTFFDGTLVKTYRVSTGLYYPTPTGKFQILNKAPNAFSSIYNVWMPWWMAFGYSNELNAYFGLHELPYWLSPDGTKKQRPRERIGTPSTGGCVALDIGEAEEFYGWSDVGMPVVIFK